MSDKITGIKRTTVSVTTNSYGIAEITGISKNQIINVFSKSEWVGVTSIMDYYTGKPAVIVWSRSDGLPKAETTYDLVVVWQ